jgi:hypothetical protein
VIRESSQNILQLGTENVAYPQAHGSHLFFTRIQRRACLALHHHSLRSSFLRRQRTLLHLCKVVVGKKQCQSPRQQAHIVPVRSRKEHTEASTHTSLYPPLSSRTLVSMSLMCLASFLLCAMADVKCDVVGCLEVLACCLRAAFIPPASPSPRGSFGGDNPASLSLDSSKAR